MSLRRPPRPDDDNEDAWLITFADMVTLLLCFFIIMFSLSVPDQSNFAKVAHALRKEGFYTSVIEKEDAFNNLKEQLDLSLGASGYGELVAVSSTPSAVDVELSSSAFFQAGGAKFTREALPILKLMSDQILPLKDEDVIISVEGHTDDTLVRTPQFPSNWELAGARASNVVRYLAAQGFPKEKLRAISMGDAHPKAANRDTLGTPLPANQDLNRRVVIKMTKGED